MVHWVYTSVETGLRKMVAELTDLQVFLLKLHLVLLLQVTVLFIHFLQLLFQVLNQLFVRFFLELHLVVAFLELASFLFVMSKVLLEPADSRGDVSHWS